jgi:hypothetical protein
MLGGRGAVRLGVGIVLIMLGGLWVLQGLDVLGQDGGMNGETLWVVIGALVLLSGAYVAYTAQETRRRM